MFPKPPSNRTTQAQQADSTIHPPDTFLYTDPNSATTFKHSPSPQKQPQREPVNVLPTRNYHESARPRIASASFRLLPAEVWNFYPRNELWSSSSGTEPGLKWSLCYLVLVERMDPIWALSISIEWINNHFCSFE